MIFGLFRQLLWENKDFNWNSGLSPLPVGPDSVPRLTVYAIKYPAVSYLFIITYSHFFLYLFLLSKSVVFGSGPQAESHCTNKVYRSRTQTCMCAKSLMQTCTRVHTPEVADLPGSRVEKRGSDKETRETAPVEPGGRAMPLVHRQEVQHRPAYQAGKDPKLDRKKHVKLLLLVKSNVSSLGGLIVSDAIFG